MDDVGQAVPFWCVREFYWHNTRWQQFAADECLYSGNAQARFHAVFKQQSTSEHHFSTLFHSISLACLSQVIFLFIVVYV